MKCNTVRKEIDQADRPSVIGLEAARHMQACTECKTFAEERAALFELLNSTGRVAAPADFNVAVRRRLAQRAKPTTAVSWFLDGIFPGFSTAFAVRLGGALAVLVCTVILGQYMRHTVNNGPMPTGPVAEAGIVPGSVAPHQTPGTVPISPEFTPVANGSGSRQAHHYPPRARPSAGLREAEFTASADQSSGAGKMHIVGLGGEGEMMVQPLSVGAQPLFYLEAKTPSRVVGASF
jgi:hypothetical protein